MTFVGWLSNQSKHNNRETAFKAIRGTIDIPCNTDNLSFISIPFSSTQTFTLAATDRIYSEKNLIIAVTGNPFINPDIPTEHKKSIHHSIAYLYRLHGKKFVDHINGVFSVVLVDVEQNYVLLTIDHIGADSLYYAKKDGDIFFGNRADQIRQHPLFDSSLDLQSIYNYFYFHMVPSPDSIYSDIQKLLPAEMLVASCDRLERCFHWKLDYINSTNTSQETLSEQFKELFKTSVKERSQEKKTGCFLSGGTDSTAVAGFLGEATEKSPETFSIGFDAEGFDEMEFARAAAKHFSANPHEYYVTPTDVVDAIPKIAAAYDEPFGNASAIPTYFCAKMAKESGFDVILAGDGGDEIFAGNARYAKQLLFENYYKIPSIFRSTLIEPIDNVLSPLHKAPLFSKLHSFVEQARIPLPDRMETYNFLHRTPLVEMFAGDFLEQINSARPLENLREVYGRTFSNSALNKMMHLDMKITLADNDLRKVGRMCELAGIEVQYPILDKRIVEFAAVIPTNLKLKNYKLRYFYKEALKDFLPQSTLTKSKHGFGLPFGVWMNEHKPLNDLAMSNLESFKKRSYMNPKYIDKLLDLNKTPHASYYGVMIWVIMMLEQWLLANKL